VTTLAVSRTPQKVGVHSTNADTQTMIESSSIGYLEGPSLEISKIAWLLGYSEVTSFNHAFLRWTSISPRAVRAQLALGKNGAK
jgi:AraC-like DNA-binding protein